MEFNSCDVPMLSNPMLREVTSIMDLPRAMIVEILSRLPIKSVFRCKIVRKSWYHLLTSDPLFHKMYNERSFNSPSILLSIDDSVKLLVQLKDDNDPHPLRRAIVLRTGYHLPPPIKETLTLIGSCNGLICLLNGGEYSVNRSICISNPILGEYFEIKVPEWKKCICGWHIVYGFCFSGEATGGDQYKVLRFKFRREFLESPIISELKVYTVGVDEKWRNLGEVPKPPHGSFVNVNVNGVVHWMDEENDGICSFNVSTEEVKSLSAPHSLQISSNHMTLVELGNCLCLSDNSNNEYVDIWWMKEYGIAESWTKTRILKDTIQLSIRDDIFTPVLTWKDEEILMRRDCGTQLVSYVPKEKKFRKDKAYCGNKATKYIPSFNSLKTIMGENFQVSKCLSED